NGDDGRTRAWVELDTAQRQSAEIAEICAGQAGPVVVHRRLHGACYKRAHAVGANHHSSLLHMWYASWSVATDSADATLGNQHFVDREILAELGACIDRTIGQKRTEHPPQS